MNSEVKLYIKLKDRDSWSFWQSYDTVQLANTHGVAVLDGYNDIVDFELRMAVPDIVIPRIK